MPKLSQGMLKVNAEALAAVMEMSAMQKSALPSMTSPSIPFQTPEQKIHWKLLMLYALFDGLQILKTKKELTIWFNYIFVHRILKQKHEFYSVFMHYLLYDWTFNIYLFRRKVCFFPDDSWATNCELEVFRCDSISRFGVWELSVSKWPLRQIMNT